MYLPHFAALEIPRAYVSISSLGILLLPRRKLRETHLDSFIIIITIITCDSLYCIVLLLLYL